MKKTIAIDLNDVVRDFSGQFTFLYKKYIDGTCEIKKEDITDFDLSNVFEFEDEDAYRNFRFVDYAFDLHARAMMCDDRLSASLNNWICNELGNLDEPPTILVVSPFEIALTIQSTLSFLAAHGCREREYYFPMDSATIWDRCDVLMMSNLFVDNINDSGCEMTNYHDDRGNESQVECHDRGNFGVGTADTGLKDQNQGDVNSKHQNAGNQKFPGVPRSYKLRKISPICSIKHEKEMCGGCAKQCPLNAGANDTGFTVIECGKANQCCDNHIENHRNDNVQRFGHVVLGSFLKWRFGRIAGKIPEPASGWGRTMRVQQLNTSASWADAFYRGYA
jgi:hypothetical protein